MANTIKKTKTSVNSDRKKQTLTDGQSYGDSLTGESCLSGGRFSSRLKEAKGSESVLHLAGRAGLSEAVIRQYLKEESDPSRVSLIRMARALGVNIAWLATGEGPMKSGDEVTDERASYTAAARDPVDVERLEEAINAVETYLQERGVARPPAVKAQLISLLYQIGRRKELIEKNDLVGLLDLIY